MCTMRLAVSLSLLLAVVGMVGCQSLGEARPTDIVRRLDIPDGVPWKSKKKPEVKVPARIAATWTNAVRQQPGKASQRGFGGRLYFYHSKDSEPVAVDGQLVVYAFDETGRKPTDNKPSRRFVFPPEQFAKHLSESEFGVSYSVWLPWGDVAGPSADVSLIARFEPRVGGTLLVSEQATSRLPGLGGESVELVKSSVSSEQLKPVVQQATHESSPTLRQGDNTAQKPRRRMETTSIKLPSGSLRGASTGHSAWRTDVSYPGPKG